MFKIRTILIFFIFSILSGFPALAQDFPTFRLPVDCHYGEDCWVMNYVDMGSLEDGKNTDPACGTRTYDGHKGTDMAIRSKAEMDKGVSVLAAAGGKVIRVRDGQPDRFSSEEELQEIKKNQKECGNAVLIEHGNALRTLYCHLKENSILVKANDEIKAGQKIGEIGLSGYTEFPHLHFGILWEGNVMDPFTGLSNTEKCGSVKQSLWDPSANISYHPVSLYAAGFQNEIPDLDKIDRGQTQADSFKKTLPVLAFWTAFLGVQEGDSIVMEIRSPNERLFSRRTLRQPATRTRQLYYTGRKLSEDILEAGTYIGKSTLTRTLKDGQLKSWTIERTVQVREE